jgi:phosphate transport system protein
VQPPSFEPSSELKYFKRALKKIEQDVLRMGTLVEQSFRLSHQALFERELEFIEKITLLDKRIDQYYRQIESDCSNLMILQSPVAQDLRLLSAYMQLVRDLERIGDYAKDLAEIAVRLFIYTPHDCMKEIELMSRHAQWMLATSLVALADLDGNVGRQIKQLDDTVDDAYDRVYNILAYERDIKGVLEPFLLMALTIRHLERMADHATNIGQRVFYIVTGLRN